MIIIINKGRNVLVIDLEFARTYKKKLKKTAIMEVGMVLVRNIGTSNEKVIEYSKMFNPGVGISLYASKITGINSKMLKGFSHIKSCCKEIQDFINYADIIVFHGGKQDIYALELSGFDLREKEIIDTQVLARTSHENFNSYRLEEVANVFNIDTSGSHRALKDAKLTLELYRELATKDNLYPEKGRTINKTI